MKVLKLDDSDKVILEFTKDELYKFRYITSEDFEEFLEESFNNYVFYNVKIDLTDGKNI